MEEGADQVAETLDQRQKLFELHRELCKEALALMKKKNADYSPGNDAFRNFRRHGPFGIVVRLDDKMARLQTFIERKTYETDGESLRDTIVDGINYLVLCYALITE